MRSRLGQWPLAGWEARALRSSPIATFLIRLLTSRAINPWPFGGWGSLSVEWFRALEPIVISLPFTRPNPVSALSDPFEGREGNASQSLLDCAFLAGCIYALLVGVEQGVGTYYNEYLWQWKPEQIAPFALFTALSVIVTVSLAPFIARGRDKKNIAVGIFLFTVAVGPLPVLLRLLDLSYGTSLSPDNGSDLLWVILLVHTCTMSLPRRPGLRLYWLHGHGNRRRSSEANGAKGRGLVRNGQFLRS